MFRQFLIERGDEYHAGQVTVHLYFVGVQNLEFKYQDELIQHGKLNPLEF